MNVLNKSKILHTNAIRRIFEDQFEANMNMTTFRSWLAYFHDFQHNSYYNAPECNLNTNNMIIGYKHIWQVIHGSLQETAIIAMMGELIKLHHVQNKMDGDVDIANMR